MNTKSRRLCIPKDFWTLVFLALFLSINGCENRDGMTASEGRSKDAVEPVGEEDVLAQAKLFLHLLRGTDAKDYYTNPKRPPEVGIHSDQRRWFIFFNTPAGGFNIQLDENAKRGNYLFQSGAVIRRDVDQKVDVHFPPLYSLEEMEELLQLPHNRWAVD